MTSVDAAVRILYTARLEGRLSLLPYLFTVLKRERSTAPGLTVLVDLGRACAPGSWICDITNGRGMLVAMDAMGYDAFHIGPLDALYTQPALVQQIKQVIATPLAAGPWHASVQRQGCQFTLYNAAAAPPRAPADLVIGLRLSDREAFQTAWDGSRRFLLLDSGLDSPSPTIGRIDSVWMPEPPYIRIVERATLAVAPDTLPDPTIAGVLEFVKSEARCAAQKRGNA